MASTIYWPDNLPDGVPLPLRDGYGYTPRSPSVATQFALITRSRPVFSDAPVDFDVVQWLCTADQKPYLEAFWFHRLAAGTRAFWLRLLINGQLEQREVNFHGRIPTYELVGVNHWRVRGAVTTLAGVQMSASEFDLVEAVGGIPSLREHDDLLRPIVNDVIPTI